MVQSSPFSSDTHSSGMFISSLSGFGEIVGNHVGPCSQILLDWSSTVEMPQEGRSAGLSFHGQCDQLATCTKSRIFVALLCTNFFHSLLTPCTQYNATLESVKHVPR